MARLSRRIGLVKRRLNSRLSTTPMAMDSRIIHTMVGRVKRVWVSHSMSIVISAAAPSDSARTRKTDRIKYRRSLSLRALWILISFIFMFF